MIYDLNYYIVKLFAIFAVEINFEMSKYKMDESKLNGLIKGYSKDIILNIPNDIYNVIILFYCEDILFNVFDTFGNIVYQKDNDQNKLYNYISINKSSLFLIGNDNELYVSGENTYGQLGINRCSDMITVNNVIKNVNFSNTSIKLISQGICNYHSFIYTNDDVLYGFGFNDSINIGIRTCVDNISKPTIIEYKFNETLKYIKCGRKHSLFLTQNKRVYGCGSNMHGQLTSKYINDNNSIKYLMDNIIDIQCSGYTSYFLNTNNTLYACGYNAYGQLGKKSFHSNDKLNIILKGKQIISFNCGFFHIGCITSDNELYLYGYNKYCQCGLSYKYESCYDGNKIHINNEVMISIKCGAYYNIIKTDKNNYYTFGENNHDQLLIGYTLFENVATPTKVEKKYVFGKMTSHAAKILDLIPSYNCTFIITTFS